MVLVITQAIRNIPQGWKLSINLVGINLVGMKNVFFLFLIYSEYQFKIWLKNEAEIPILVKEKSLIEEKCERLHLSTVFIALY